jgi:5-(carboxyamino)imidazole ribonucleotide synthase
VPDPLQHLPAALAVESARVHLYAKAVREGRKLGHVTATGPDADVALERARSAAAALGTTIIPIPNEGVLS